MALQVHASGVRFAHSLPLKSARQWGLYISESRGKTSIGIDEPALFSEPAVYLVRPDGTRDDLSRIHISEPTRKAESS